MKYFFILFVFASGANRLSGQNSNIDSLNILLKTTKHDTVKLRLLVQLSEECEMNDILKYGGPAVELADKLLKNKTQSALIILNQKARALNNIGFMYNNQGEMTMALDYYNKSLNIQKQVSDKKGIALSLNNMGAIYNNQGDIARALDYWSQSLRLQEEIGDKLGISMLLNNIGFIFNNQGDLSKSLDYYSRSLKIREELGNKLGIANSLINIGAVYNKQGDMNKALIYYERSLKIHEEIGDKAGMAYSLNNIGAIYEKKGDLINSLDYCRKSLKVQKEIGDKLGTAISQNNIGDNYFKLGLVEKTLMNRNKKYLLAIAYEDSSLALSKELGFPQNIRNAEETLSQIDSARGNYAGAFEHYKQFIIYRDSINNKETRKASIKSQLKYEYEKKEAVIKEQQEKERAVSEEQNHRQQIVIWSVACGLLLVIIFAGFVFRSLKTTREQKIIIEEKQKDILDSIRYAKRIQHSLLPNEKYIDKSFKRLMKN